VVYHGTRIEMDFQADLIVEAKAIEEIKSAKAIAPVHEKQRADTSLAGRQTPGLLINFNVALSYDGITRIANRMPD
jgi:GxxExxY protein